ncbi:glycoside hydrolase [Cyathus striatus]|nr:glycoside hydrolase [Cyathus striatus]
MFEWTWDSVAAECTNFIGSAGYGYVQVSPPQEHIAGAQWWTDYQPVSYILTSKRGNRAQFQNMIKACHTAGVGVVVDTIFNHMAGVSGGTGVGGSSFTQYNYPGTYSSTDFHYCGKRAGNDIGNYNNREDVQFCELINLADLATETSYVRSRLAAYANDLISLGADGLRLDAAKHIPTADIANILSHLTKSIYITQEVIYGSGEPIQPSEYVGNGDVQEFRYTSALKDAFLGSSISELQNLENRGWVSESQANVFVANHDTERVSRHLFDPVILQTDCLYSSLNSNSPNNAYILAHVFSLAHPYGTPTVLSSFQGFTNNDQGSPNYGVGSYSDNGGANGWCCQHRYLAISGMVGFRNSAGSAAITSWVSPQASRIAFGRGSAAFVAINTDGNSWSDTFTISLPDGTYCNVINGKLSSGACTGSSFTVSGGRFTATIGGRDALAIHIGARGSGDSPPLPLPHPPAHRLYATTTYGQNIYIVGSIPTLGSWIAASAVRDIYYFCLLLLTYRIYVALSSSAYPTWRATIALPASTAFEYKFIRKNSDSTFTWESDLNRQATTNASEARPLRPLGGEIESV